MLLSKSISLISVFLLLSMIFSAGCKSTDNNSNAPHITASELLQKVKKKIDPKGVLNQLNTLTIDGNSIEISKDNTMKEEHYYKFLYNKKDPEIFDLKKTNSIIEEKQNTETVYDVVIIDGDAKVFKNGKAQTSKTMDPDRIKYMVEYTKGYMKNMSYCIFENFLSMSLDDDMYRVDGQNCYKLSATLPDIFFDGSSFMEYYIDSENYVIRMIITQKLNIECKEYKQFGDIFWISKTKITPANKFYNKDEAIRYYNVKDLTVNKELDISKYCSSNI